MFTFFRLMLDVFCIHAVMYMCTYTYVCTQINLYMYLWDYVDIWAIDPSALQLPSIRSKVPPNEDNKVEGPGHLKGRTVDKDRA